MSWNKTESLSKKLTKAIKHLDKSDAHLYDLEKCVKEGTRFRGSKVHDEVELIKNLIASISIRLDMINRTCKLDKR